MIQKLPLAQLVALSLPAGLPGRLVALHAIKNEALAGETLPVRLKLLNWGDNQTATKGVVRVGKATVAALAANQARFGYDQIALDYNHNSLPGHANFQADPRKVAAYGTPEVIEGDGIYVTALSYTPSGTEHAREYHDLSPTPLLDERGEVIFLHSVALCPQGEVKGLSFFSADFLNRQSQTMDPKKLLLALLGLSAVAELTGLQALSADASDADIEAASKALVAKLDKAKPATPAAGQPDLTALTATLTEQGKALVAMSARFEAQERESITAAAVREGKIIPLSAKELSLEQFKKIVAELPAGQVPLEQRTPEGLQALAASGLGGAVDASAEEVRKRLGISKEVWEKHPAK